MKTWYRSVWQKELILPMRRNAFHSSLSLALLPRVAATATCFAALLAFTATTAQARNLLTDPGFESGAPGQLNPIPIPGGVGGGWAVFNGATFSRAHPESGTYSLQASED